MRGSRGAASCTGCRSRGNAADRPGGGDPVRIGILETGAPPGDLAAVHGRYDAMVRDMLGDGHAYTTFRVTEGEWPVAADSIDAFVITGSSAGVQDGLPWVADLAAFLRDVRGRTKLVGICFGHQVMAQAFGGTVAKAAQGWGLGLHRYAVNARPEWIGDTAGVAVMASHQDQVVVPPPGATVVGGSAFTPHAIIDYGDDAISFQFHPEFTTAFSRALIDVDRATDMTDALKGEARRSLDDDGDARVVAGWIDRFLRD